MTSKYQFINKQQQSTRNIQTSKTTLLQIQREIVHTTLTITKNPCILTIMASRFPSIEEFDDGQISASDPIDNPSSLFEREQAALGDAANEFKSQDHDSNAFPDFDDADGDLLGGDAPSGNNKTHNTNSSFEDSFPAIGMDYNEV